MTGTLAETEPFKSLLKIGEILGNHAINTRPVTLVGRGNMDPDAWKRAPRRLARKLCANTSVHFSLEHPDMIVIISQGRWASHLTAHDIHQLIGPGAIVRHVLGEKHPEIPFVVSCDDFLESRKTRIL